MTRHDRPEGRPSEVGTSRQSTSAPGQPVRGTYARLIADPELLAADLLERMGPVMAGAVAAALLDLVRSTGRVIG
jgi:hypothetical protein